jgi:hypothetical protein
MRLTSEAGISALLGAAAGFLISQSKMFVAGTPVEAFQSGWLLLVYAIAFGSCPILVQSISSHLRKEGGAIEIASSCASLLISYYVIVGRLISFDISKDSFSIKLTETYSGPLIMLPLVWLLLHAIDEALEVADVV